MAHFVYVIAEEIAGPCKVGISGNVEARCFSLQTGNPRPLVIFHKLALARLSDAARLESECHKFLAKKRRGGEWFDVTVDEAISAITELLRFGTETGFDSEEWRKPTFQLRIAK